VVAAAKGVGVAHVQTPSDSLNTFISATIPTSTEVTSHPSYLIPILCRASSTNSIPFSVHSSSSLLPMI